MKITALKQGRGNKCHVHVDGRYLLTLHIQEAERHSLTKDREVTGAELDLWLLESQTLFAKDYAMAILSRRSISEKELLDKLLQKPHSENISPEDWEQAAEAAVERMKELGLVDDEDYAGKLARDLSHLRKLGPRRIRQELMQKGVDRELAEEAVEDLDQNPQEDIMELLEGKFARLAQAAAEGEPKEKQRLIGRLLRMGYGYSDIRQAWDLYLEDWE
ncbi:MAG: regulatory protein RecX [Oscillospiraceae bacterium]|jgi:regulatory protein|nr:regulatory protein RecX [Oscillospiraceae bacterium]